jgi:Ca-activated chloride channel homolog
VNPEPQVVQAMRFGHPALLWLLLGVPLGALLVAAAWKARGRARRTWVGDLFARLNPLDDPGRDRLRVALFLLGYAFLVLAMARPQWGGEMVMMKRRGIDVLVAVDVSNSMLAEDMRPNRLAAAKRAIADLVARMGGDRLGLIAFAGDAYTVCPLTLDHGTVLLLLDSLNPSAVSFGGTNLEEAIRRARASFVREERRYKALVIVTDGESTTGDPVREAEQAAEEGVIVYCIGIGSPDGQPIPMRDGNGVVTGYRRDNGGQVVNSRLDAAVLEKIATAAHGRAFRATPQGLELSTVFDELQSLEKKELQGQLATNYEERYQWPLGMAAIVLALEMLVPNRRRRLGTT